MQRPGEPGEVRTTPPISSMEPVTCSSPPVQLQNRDILEVGILVLECFRVEICLYYVYTVYYVHIMCILCVCYVNVMCILCVCYVYIRYSVVHSFVHSCGFVCSVSRKFPTLGTYQYKV